MIRCDFLDWDPIWEICHTYVNKVVFIMILYFIITNSFMFVFFKFFQAIFSYFKKKN